MKRLFSNALLTILISFVLLLSLDYAIAHSSHPEHDWFERAEAIINVEIPCDKLTDEQLEIIGDYYMEKIHPGEVHELMDQMMGGEGSENLKLAHIQMAKRLYCNEGIYGMMSLDAMTNITNLGGMMNMMGTNMMGYGGMMNMMGYGMMGNWGYGVGYWNFINVLYVILLIGLIVLVYLWIAKLWKNMK